MFRLGIIGSDNSHAERFSALTNLEGGIDGMRIEDARVTHIYGTDPARTREVATKSQIPHIVEKLEDMIGEVDGVLCVWRHGSKHLEATLPFLQHGIPAFVDKPLASSVADARALIDAAEKAKVGFTSFSTLRYARSTVDWMAGLPAAIGDLRSGMSAGPADRSSEYDGIFFYGIHAVELMNAVWGYGCRAVTATENEKNAVAVCAFDGGKIVTLNFLGDAKYLFHLTAYGVSGSSQHEVDSSTTYFDGMQVIMRTLKTGEWPLTPAQLIESVRILEAIEQSLTQNQQVALKTP